MNEENTTILEEKIDRKEERKSNYTPVVGVEIINKQEKDYTPVKGIMADFEEKG